MKKNKNASSLIIAIWITLVMSLLALYILEYIIPFGKNTKNIEQSVNAYYQADSAIEDSLLSIKWKKLWYEKVDLLNWNIDFAIKMTASWTVLPPVWRWNSEFDEDYNIIKIWEPIQIEIWNWKKSNLKIYFKVPDLDKTSNETLSWTTLKIVNWQLSWKYDVLNSSWSQITASEIDGNNINIWNRNWRKLDDSPKTFNQFYTDNCNWSNSWCILKMSILNKLELDSWNTSVPYLEWKIENDNSIPLRYTIINTTWKSYGFQKSLEVKVPQQTVNEAFDFTVFQ